VGSIDRNHQHLRAKKRVCSVTWAFAKILLSNVSWHTLCCNFHLWLCGASDVLGLAKVGMLLEHVVLCDASPFSCLTHAYNVHLLSYPEEWCILIFSKELGLLQVDKNESDTDGCISCRVTIFEDHMIRDINAGRFSSNSSLVLLTHGLALRIFLMRWFHWTVDEFLNVFNPPNCQPLVCGPSTKPWSTTPCIAGTCLLCMTHWYNR
jgi:hypothetical protein